MTKRAENIVGLTDPSDSAQPANIAGGQRSFTARMQHEHLEAALKGWDLDSENAKNGDPEIVPVEQIPSAQPDAAPSAAPEQTKPARRWWRLKEINTSTIMKSAVALVAALVLGWMPVHRLLATTSAEAVINARVTSIRTPIAGNVSALPGHLAPGTAFQAGDVLLTIKNPRTDSTNLDNLKRTVEQLTTNIAALRAKEAVLKSHRAELAAQKERFRTGRIETLKRQISETDAKIASADAQHNDAEKTLARARALFAQKTVSEAFYDKAVRDESVALETINQLRERRKATQVELASAREGTFIADGYNDTPQSAQRGLDIELELADVGARLVSDTKQLAAVTQDLVRETMREHDLSTAVIRASVSGRVWESMTALGEYVNAGQVLMRLLDCGSAVVTASVSESVFQKLMIGQRATFKPSDGGPEVKGWIVDLSGLAAVPSNDAIQSKLLSREPYHVTLRFPALANRESCEISRPGLVTFDTTSSPLETTALRLGDAQ